METVALEPLVQQFAWLLLGAALVAIAARAIRVPYAVALVIVGLLVEESHVVSVPSLQPSLVLLVFLPPLLFDAAFRLDVWELRSVLRPVLVLAVPGVLGTAALVGVILALVLGLPLAVGLLFGAIVAATDPVAVTSVFRQLGAPARLATIVEGESLINDGMAITVYIALLGFTLTGTIDPLHVVTLFGRQVLGGLAVGAVLAFGFARVTRVVDDHLIEMTLSTALAYGSYLIADSLETSGALACVAAGLLHGSYGRASGMSANTAQLLDYLWEYLGFAANAVLFLLVGFSVNVAALLAQWWPVVVAVFAVAVARAVVILIPRLVIPQERLITTRAERLVLGWGGLRGALTIALALALPPDTPERDLVTTMAFGVVLFTLLVQGLTLPMLLRRLGLTGPPQPAD